MIWSMRGLFVVADDRTGALEVAGACADATGAPVVVETSLRHDDGAPRIRVVDLGTRHLAAREAADRAGAVGTFDAAAADSPVVHAHKIDSTLRGNWAAELVARHVATGRRVLVVPAFPLVGRQCIGGVVVANGVPVAEGAAGVDARGAVASSRPAELLRAAGASTVVELRRGAPLDGWLRRTSAASAAFAVCDAGDDSDLHAIAAAWTDVAVDVLFAGTAGSIGAAAAALAGPGGPRGP